MRIFQLIIISSSSSSAKPSPIADTATRKGLRVRLVPQFEPDALQVMLGHGLPPLTLSNTLIRLRN